ncbi:hypothetical protein AV530_015922 [Patagioenas fasciata monilis]|uniref:Uncharacterized protein n=1 Tax=Patagioenas fasciata monilis TaxID=372326 RepID=A0A1V4KJB6_PATFA|nr:hypothetical protein AV530_015922 [Patagioenas fasciata monilis]
MLKRSMRRRKGKNLRSPEHTCTAVASLSPDSAKGMCCYIVVACEEKTSGSCCQRILSFSAGPEEFSQLTGR